MITTNNHRKIGILIRMHGDTKRSWDRSERLKADLLNKVALMPETTQHNAANGNEWSPLQIVSHLLVAERFVLGYQTKTGEPLPRRANPFVIGLLCMVLRAGIRLPAPEVMTPDSEPPPLESLAEQWKAEREKMYSRLNGVLPNEPFGLHPYFGVVTTQQVMEMLEAHLQYHTKRFPKNKPR